MDYNQVGIQMCSRYAFPPNRLHYCGPEKQLNLKSYIETSVIDKGLPEILVKFETLYPYLQMIAGANYIKDPFDIRVVEAYWIGNGLLTRVKPRLFHRHLVENLGLMHKLPTKQKSLVADAAMGLPHHTFHVLALYIRSGNHNSIQTLETMDNCRIGWGKIVGLSNQNNNHEYLITRQSLGYENDKLILKSAETEMVKSLNLNYKIGDTVSDHWGYITGKLNSRQVLNLKKYTQDAIDWVNRQQNRY
jgi:hypothetical protein